MCCGTLPSGCRNTNAVLHAPWPSGAFSPASTQPWGLLLIHVLNTALLKATEGPLYLFLWSPLLSVTFPCNPAPLAYQDSHLPVSSNHGNCQTLRRIISLSLHAGCSHLEDLGDQQTHIFLLPGISTSCYQLFNTQSYCSLYFSLF
jgi:hypothetical protein